MTGPLIERISIQMTAEDDGASAGVTYLDRQIQSMARTTEAQGVGAAQALARSLDLFSRSSDNSTAALKRTQNAAQALALSIAGVHGPVGVTARALSVMAFGGGLATAVALGIGAIGAAYRKLSEDARKAREEQERQRDATRRIAEEFRSGLDEEPRLEASARARRVQIDTWLEDLRQEDLLADRFGRDDPLIGGPAARRAGARARQIAQERAALDAEEARLMEIRAERQSRHVSGREREIAALTGLVELGARDEQTLGRIRELHEAVTAELRLQGIETERRLDLLRQEADLLRSMAATGVWAHPPVFIDKSGTRIGTPGFFSEGESPFAPRRLQLGPIPTGSAPAGGSPFAFAGERRDVLTADVLETEALVKAFADAGWSLNDIADAAHNAAKATDEAARAQERFAIASINTVASLMSMVASGGGGIGDIITLGGGFLSFINPIAGAAVSAGGQIISALERDDANPLPVRISDVSPSAAAALANADRGPMVVDLTIVDRWGTELEHVYYTADRRERLDAQERIPLGGRRG